MKRPSKKDIRAAVDKLKEKKDGSYKPEANVPNRLEEKKSSQRIRKKGV